MAGTTSGIVVCIFCAAPKASIKTGIGLDGISTAASDVRPRITNAVRRGSADAWRQ